MANVGEVVERLRAALQDLRPDELKTSAELLREEVLVVLTAAAAESNHPELQEAVEPLTGVPDELEAAAALYEQARSGTERYIQQHSGTGGGGALPAAAAAPSATPSSGSCGMPRSEASTTPPAATKPSSTKASPSKSKPASFGWTTSTNYRKTFFDAHPDTEGKVVVHHAVEQQVLRIFPGVVQTEEVHSLENLRGIPKGLINNRVHLSAIRIAWNDFYKPFRKSGTRPTKQQLLDFATMIDDQYGTSFNPNIR
ncbi:hypothetical protein NLX83_01715 [Allokutzneria sp. A3M-2-11 16]|uniref:hypothetical protein n=1 Tax=Allokutzneria sp. A3M-2-11 16 TaxID=2962043 RepID=UPI0020B6BAA0|nr:hypothetical protein [Allokutzneria sp. A3M-2-11 16]MCP3797966.1 hypothetical protein [Allokutzneria sp. A3M-2-11 16]